MITVILLTIITRIVNSQDLHFSQFYYNNQSTNPSIAGLIDGDHRFTANYRNQWLSVPVPYLTLSALFDTKFRINRGQDFIGLGFGLDYDQAGDSKLAMAKVLAEVSYNKFFLHRHSIGIGVQIGGAQRRLSNELLRWDVQWNGDKYDPSIGSRESFNQVGSFFADIGAGANYRYAKNKRTKLSLSAGLFHLNRPNQNFYGSAGIKAKLPLRSSYMLGISLPMGRVIDLVLTGQYQTQEDYKEQIIDATLRCYLNKKPGKILNMLVGGAVRLGDALIPRLGFEYNNWIISGSYDMNTSAFKTATNKRGGPELALQYIFRSVAPIEVYKKCPIY